MNRSGTDYRNESTNADRKWEKPCFKERVRQLADHIKDQSRKIVDVTEGAEIMLSF